MSGSPDCNKFEHGKVDALGSVMVTVLTGTGDGKHDFIWMPGSDTGNLSKTLVRLSWQLFSAPSMGNTFETFTFSDGNDIDVLVLFED